MDNNSGKQELEALGYARAGIDDAEHGIACMVWLCHNLALGSGWWNRRTPNVPADLAEGVADYLADEGAPIGGVLTAEEISGLVPEKLMLIVSEVAEAMEGHRKGLKDDHLPNRSMLEVELADTVIRVSDLAGALGLDLAGAIIEKLAYNQRRADHKPEARAADGGKAY